MTQQTNIDRVDVLPDRNFVAGQPKNPATFVAHSTDGEYFEGFVSEYADEAAFRKTALTYFNRQSLHWA